MAISSTLKTWKEVRGYHSWSALIGNGFSIYLWDRFKYEALYRIACSKKVSVPLSKNVRRVFRFRKTTNFEEVLESLSTASYVDSLNGGSSKKFITTLRRNTRNGLASALQWVHVPPCCVDLALLCNRLQRFRAVYTTNYDLTIYWSMIEDTAAFADFFWAQGGYFDPFDARIRGNRVPVFFLHGGLHLRKDKSGNNFKVKANQGALLNQLVKDLRQGASRPLIVTEGTHGAKYQRIEEAPYLRFAIDQLKRDSRSLVVLGQSLSPKFDLHLVEAINENRNRCVAVGLWKGIGKNRIVQEKARLRDTIKVARRVFFDIETHPLFDKSLRLQPTDNARRWGYL